LNTRKNEITLYIEVGEVPKGQYVSKINGFDRFKVCETLSIYKSTNETLYIEADEGTLFLVNASSMQAVSKTTKVLWETSPAQILLYTDQQKQKNFTK
jgi:hypothetical protein